MTLLKSAGEKTQGGEKADVSEEIRGIGEKLKKLFNVTDFTRLDSVVVQGVEGQRVAYVMGGGYRLEFFLDPSRDGTQVQLRDLSLERVRREAGKEVRGEIVRTSINVNARAALHPRSRPRRVRRRQALRRLLRELAPARARNLPELMPTYVCQLGRHFRE